MPRLKKIFSCLFLFFIVSLLAAPAKKISMLPQVCIFKGKNGTGTGFFLKVDKQNFIVTNNHVLLELDDVEIVDINGGKIPFFKAFVSPDRDLAYIPLQSFKGSSDVFQVHPAPTKIVPEQKVEALGNSLGQNVVVSAKGKFLGVGPGYIEVSTPFVPGNSGGPVILSGTNQVIGVATFLQVLDEPQVTTIGSRFEVKNFKPAIRRFATRIDDVHYSSFEKMTLSQIREDHKEFSKIQKLEKDILSILQEPITSDSVEKLQNYRYSIRNYISKRKWHSSFLKKTYEKKYQFIYDFLKKIFPGTEYEFSISPAERQKKLKEIWMKHLSSIQIKKDSGNFQMCGICRGHGNIALVEKKILDYKNDAVKTTCYLCAGKKKFQIRPARQYVLFTKSAIQELTSVIEKENRQICGYYLGSSSTASLFKEKFYKRRRWKVQHDGCFRVFSYPGNAHFRDAAETRFWFFGSKLMRVDLYFPIFDDKSALETEINFYRKYYPGDKNAIVHYLRSGKIVQHPQICSERFHKIRDLFFNLYNNPKKKGEMTPLKSPDGSRFPVSTLITNHEFQDPCGIYMAHRTLGRCICNYGHSETKKFLCLSLRHADFDLVKDLMQKRHSSVQF